MRVNNLEFRKSTYLEKEPEYCNYEIVLWKPNYYYKREDEYIEEGDWYRPLDDNYKCMLIHKDCFETPETCITIVSFKRVRDHYKCNFINDRFIQCLSNEGWDTLRYLIKYGLDFLKYE